LPIFKPPTVDEGPAGGGHFLSRYKIARGDSIVKNGATYTRIRTPSLDEFIAATFVYQGGHEYEVSEGEKTALIAAGIGITEGNFT
jgi:hypothetical protein